MVEYVDRYYTLVIIKSDIEQGRTRVLVKEGEIIATGSRVDNHIMRVYVLPEYQGQGFGGMMMDELEKEIFAAFDDCELEASLPACIFYENRGYKTVKHVKEDIGNGKCMIYEIMRKEKNELSKGIAKTLLSKVVDEARKQGCGTVQITASDMGVLLYSNFGFEKNDNFMQYKL